VSFSSACHKAIVLVASANVDNVVNNKMISGTQARWTN